MFCFVDAVGVDAEERVREPATAEGSRVGEEDRDEKAAEGEDDAEAEGAKAVVNFTGSDDPAKRVSAGSTTVTWKYGI